MPAYHSSFNDLAKINQVGNIAVLPIKTKIKGNAPVADASQDDIIDEALYLYRANCLFRNFEIKGPADRLLIYELLFIQELLQKLQQKLPNLAEAQKLLTTHALKSFAIPGDSTFPLNAMYEKVTARADQDFLRTYLSQVRQETVARVLAKVYEGTDNNQPSKWWMCFAKRKFMGLANVGTAP